MKKSLSLFLFIFLLMSPLFAQLKDFTINADRIAFEKEKNRIEAEGSVEAVYKDFLLHGNHLIYNTSAETFFADRGFSFNYRGMTIEGDTLDYKIKEATGTATQVSFLYEDVRLGGGWIGFDSEKYELKNAVFSTCDLPHPHYRVTAADLLLYPRYDWMVAYWGFFWLGNVPMVPMPTYIYDFRAAEKAQRNLPPFPEIGANDEDGSYISETLAWHLRREFSGTYSLNYAANKGTGGGVAANYIINDQNNGDIRVNGNFKDGLFGGITHTLAFGSEMESADRAALGFFVQPHYRQYELETTLSFRERINYQKVSQTPNVKFRTRGGQFDLELFSGLIAEEGNTRLVRGGENARVYREFPVAGIDYATPSLALDSSFYSNGSRWIKPSFGLDLTKRFPRDLSLELGYVHYFLVDGASPFNYEMYRFRAADRLKSSLYFKIGETRGKISPSYFLDDWSPEDIDYSLFFRLHCYDLEMTYRSMRREFLLGFSLGTR
jgi:hypothetical protein